MTLVPRSSIVARLVLAVATAYFLIHLPLLAPSLEDIDSINFALGLSSFDLVRHQPHPPGYPIYILLGRVSRWAFSVAGVTDPSRVDALALAIWSAVGGAIALLGASRVYVAVERRFGDDSASASTALWATCLLASAPLFWMCGLRPMSDMPGLAAVLWSQALLVEGTASTSLAMGGALLGGLAAGIRIQNLALTTPAMFVVLLSPSRAGLVARAGGLVAAASVGIALWAVPLVVLSGGPSAYLGALGTQAGEDFAFVNMLWSDPTIRRLVLSGVETFVLPWHAWGLAATVAGACGIGLVLMTARAPRAVGVMLVLYVPYLAYHLLFQETITVRYALPGIPLVTWLAAGATRASWLRLPLVALVVVALTVSVAGGLLYARGAHPSYAALADARRLASGSPPARVYSHFSTRRALQHGGADLPFVEPSREYESLGPQVYWREGGQGSVWFFADPRRTDLSLLDPRSRRDVTRYEWTAGARQELSGVRPVGVHWYRLSVPGWFTGEGWSLTPETGGLMFARKSGPRHRPIQAWVRRRPEETLVVVGGAFLSSPVANATVELRVTLDGVQVDAWRMTPDQPRFLRFIRLVPGALVGTTPYATLQIETPSGRGQAVPEIAIQQFDVQSASEVVYGFGPGWYDAESEPSTGSSWRWTGERAVLELQGRPQALKLSLRGEAPLKYFDVAPTVLIESGGRVLHRWQPSGDIDVGLDIPVDVWRDRAATITIRTDRIYLPGLVEGTADTRRLGLRLFDVRLDVPLP